MHHCDAEKGNNIARGLTKPFQNDWQGNAALAFSRFRVSDAFPKTSFLCQPLNGDGYISNLRRENENN